MTNLAVKPTLADKIKALKLAREQPEQAIHDDHSRPIEELEPPADFIEKSKPKQERPRPLDAKIQADTAIGTLPVAPDAEKGLLSSILHDNQLLNRTLENIGGSSAIYEPSTRIITEAVIDLHDNFGHAQIDFITLAQYLDDRKLLAQAGGAANVSEMFTFVPTAKNVVYYTDIVKEKADLRSLIHSCRRLIDQALVSKTPDQTAQLFDEAEQAVRAITQTRRNGYLPAMDDLSMLIGANLPAPPTELVQGILHQGSKLILGGTSKGRKTFSLLDLAISVATGTDWWGIPTVKGPVCYINFEIQLPFFAKRFGDICRKKECMPEKGMFMGWTLRGMVEGIEKMADAMIKSLQDHQFALIVIDPIYKALGDRDENKAGDVASMLNELERIAVKTGAAIAFGAHYSKGNQAAKESIDRIGGSGVFARDPDSILTMTPHSEEDHFIVNATLRNFRPTEPFVLRWDFPIFEREPLANPEDIKLPKQTKSSRSGEFQDKYSNEDLINLMKVDNNGKRVGEIQKLAYSEIGMSRATFFRLWKEITASASVSKRDDNRWIVI